jgi:hypothetical protein
MTDLEKIDYLAAMEPGWADGHEPALFPAAVGAAKTMLESVSKPPQHIVPTSQGGLQFEWYSQHRDIEIEFEKDGTVVVLVTARNGQEYFWDECLEFRVPTPSTER